MLLIVVFGPIQKEKGFVRIVVLMWYDPKRTWNQKKLLVLEMD